MRAPKYFQKVAVSPTAVARILMHCQSGCDKGIKKGGNPIEVMGMLLGRPDPETPETIVVTDAFPLPIEGFETRALVKRTAEGGLTSCRVPEEVKALFGLSDA